MKVISTNWQAKEVKVYTSFFLFFFFRLYFKSSCKLETEKERLLLTYQVNEEIVQGRFPLNKDLALELASLMAQVRL